MKSNNMMMLFVCFAAMLFGTLARAEDYRTWKKVQKITFDGYNGQEALTNFPALVTLGENLDGGKFYYTDFLSPPFDDLRFIAADKETLLDFEIDTWDTEGASQVWVKIPELTSATTIYMYWGRAGVEAPACTTNGATWNSKYTAVWHMHDHTEDALYIAPDATSNQYTGLKKGVDLPLQVDGVIGKAQEFNANPINITGISHTSNSQTISVWVHAVKHDMNQYLIDFSVGRLAYAWSDSSGKGLSLYDGAWRLFNNKPSLNVWHHITFVANGSSKKLALYVDGVVENSGITYTPRVVGGTAAIGGYFGVNQHYFEGQLDEMRVENSIRSSDWILASYENIASNNVFQTYDDPKIQFEPETLAVRGMPTDYGEAYPPYGFNHGFPIGTNLTAHVQSALTNDTQDLEIVTTGWNRYSIDPETLEQTFVDSGSGHSFSYTHNNSIELLEWLFRYRYKATFSASGGGVTITNEWYDEGDTVSVTATAPDPGLTFTRWVGNIPENQATNLTLSFTITEPIYARAYFGDTLHVAVEGDDGNSGASWESPVASVAKALELAENYDLDTIIFSNGTYAVNAQVVLDRPLTLRSFDLDHPDSTILKGRKTAGDYSLIKLSHADAVLEGLTVRESYYSGVEIVGNGTVTNCIIRNNVTKNNTSDAYGAGVRMSGGLVTRSRIINNQATGSGGSGANGGGIYMTAGLVDSCTITNNKTNAGSSTARKGGGVYMDGAGTILRNSLIARNWHAMRAGGVYCSRGTIENCTITDNYADDVGGVGGLEAATTPKVINSIIAFNTNPSGIRNTIGTTLFTYSCTYPDLKAGDGNIDTDPQFRDFENMDYRITAGLCINGGTNLLWMVAKDLGGNNDRIIDDTVDIGAYEFKPGALKVALEGTPLEALATNLVSFISYVNGENLDGLYYKWSFYGNEVVDREGNDLSEVSHLYAPGLYTVSLTVTNNVGEIAATTNNLYIKVGPEVVYVSTNGTSVYPYQTWETAATNIQDAVVAATDASLVWVSNGTYNVSSQIEILQNIEVRSVNGPEETIVRRGSGTTRLFYLTKAGAIVNGFTLTGANDTAVYIDKKGNVINSIITNNVTTSSSTYGAGIHLDAGGYAGNCIVANNKAGSSSGGASIGAGIWMSAGSLVENCTIANNYTGTGTGGSAAGGGVSMAGGTLRNSLIFGNTHNVTAGGVYASGGTIESCTIVSNSVPTTGVGGLQNSGRTVRNTIIQFNTSADGLSNFQGASTYYNCSTYPTNGLTGSDNIDGDPLFKNVAAGDCHLTSDSPCINAGLYQDWMEGARDIIGEPRILNKIVDIGAYEGHLPRGTTIIVR